LTTLHAALQPSELQGPAHARQLLRCRGVGSLSLLADAAQFPLAAIGLSALLPTLEQRCDAISGRWPRLTTRSTTGWFSRCHKKGGF
jgi:hypothetical protein